MSFMRSDDNEDTGNGSRRSTSQTQGDISVRAADCYTMGRTADGAPRAAEEQAPPPTRVSDPQSLDGVDGAHPHQQQQQQQEPRQRLYAARANNADVHRQRRTELETVERGRQARLTRQGDPFTAESERQAGRVRRECPALLEASREAQRQRTHNVQLAQRMARVERAERAVRVEQTRRREEDARARGGDATGRGGTEMVGQEASTTPHGRFLLLQQREQYAVSRRERAQEDVERTCDVCQTQAHLDSVQQRRRLLRHEHRRNFVARQPQIAREEFHVSITQPQAWLPRHQRQEESTARQCRQRLDDVDRVETHAREVMDRVRHRRVFQRRQLWEQNVARRKARALEDLNRIRRRCQLGIDSAQRRMTLEADAARNRAIEDFARVWTRLDDDLANDAYASTCDENDAGQRGEQRHQ